MRKILLLVTLLILIASNTVYGQESKYILATNVVGIKSISTVLNKALEKAISTEKNMIIGETKKVIKSEKANSNIISKSKTLIEMKSHNYFSESITGITKQKEPEFKLQEDLIKYGTLIYKGMPTEDYKTAMEYEWEDITEYNTEPSIVDIDLTQIIDYDSYIDILKRISMYEGVFVYKIGKSTKGRDIYAIEIDLESNFDKNVIMLSGQHHSREFAGGAYILKQFSDLIQKAQWDETTMDLLKHNKYVAVPMVSLDIREQIILNPLACTMSDGQLWKAYANGTDGNRNYPGLQWGLVAKGNDVISTYTDIPSFKDYVGPYAGSSSETKAMMKWLYHYIVIEKAEYYLDYHQQGRVIFAGEQWQYEEQFDKQLGFVKDIQSIIRDNEGNTYNYTEEEINYGLRGEGSTSTDYASSLAVGGKFSLAYGFHVFQHWGREYTLMQIKDLDNDWINPKVPNENFAAATIEIGFGSEYLGYSQRARNLQAEEYFEYNFGKLLEKIPTFIH